MSINNNSNLKLIAKSVCRELRKKSTLAEKLFWDKVRDRRFNNLKFTRQHPLFFDFEGKGTFYVADFFCFEKQVIIEIDGGYHNTFQQKEKDKLRTYLMNLLGINVIRFPNERIINDLDNVLDELYKKITHPKPFSY